MQLNQRTSLNTNHLSHNPYFTGNSFAIELKHYKELKELSSQSLFYWKLFCNLDYYKYKIDLKESQSLFYWKLFCNEAVDFVFDEFYKSQSLFYWKLLCNISNRAFPRYLKVSQSLFYWKHFCNVNINY